MNFNFTAEIAFSDVMLRRNLNVLGINGVEIPGPRVVDITEPAFVTAYHEFKDTTKMTNLQIMGSLNGISIVPGPGRFSYALNITHKGYSETNAFIRF